MAIPTEPARVWQQFHVHARKIIARGGPADSHVGDDPAAHGAGQVIGEVEIADGPPHAGGPGARYRVELMAGPLKEKVGFRELPIEEAEIQALVAGRGQPWIRAHGLLEPELRRAVVLFRQEERQVLDAQGLAQALPDRRQHPVEVGFGTELAGELHQGPPVIVAVAIEIAVEPLLNPVADGLEQERRDQHDRDQPGIAQVFEVLLHLVAQREDNSVKRSQNADGGQGVGVAAAEDDIHVHQPVPHDGIGQGERDQGQRKDGHLLVGVGDLPGRIGQDIEHGKRQDAAKRAVAQPLELLPDDGILGLAVLRVQGERAHQVWQHREHQPHAVEHPAQLNQRYGHDQRTRGGRQVDGEQQQRGHIQQSQPRRLLEPFPGFREGQAEMQEDGGREQAGGHVAEVHHLVEGVELARVVESQEDERSQAENVKVLCFVRAAAPEIDEQADDQVRKADRVLIQHGAIHRHLADNQALNGDLDAAAHHQVVGLLPDPYIHQRLGDFYGFADIQAPDTLQAVALVDAGFAGRAVGRNIQRLHARGAIDPDHSVFGQVELVLFLKVDDRRHSGGECEDGEDCGR